MKPLPIQTDARRPRPSNAVRIVRRPLSAYPVLLVLSTALAGLFCYLYLTKPVIQIAAAGDSDTATDTLSAPLPRSAPRERPGRRTPLPSNPADLAAADDSSPGDAYEETNLKIQHVLSVASEDGGELGRIVTDVPVLYQSRTLRWNAGQVAQARTLLTQLRTYQQRSRELRTEGVLLLDAWQSLVSTSIPASSLRADSPTLPENQSNECRQRQRPGLETSESIEVKTADLR